MSNYHPMDVSPTGSSVHGISQARILEWVALSFSGESSHPGIEPISPKSPALADGFFTSSATWKVPPTKGVVLVFSWSPETRDIRKSWVSLILERNYLRNTGKEQRWMSPLRVRCSGLPRMPLSPVLLANKILHSETWWGSLRTCWGEGWGGKRLILIVI